MGNNICFKGVKLSLNYHFYPFLSGALVDSMDMRGKYENGRVASLKIPISLLLLLRGGICLISIHRYMVSVVDLSKSKFHLII